MTTYLFIQLYEDESELHFSDQIHVPFAIWESFCPSSDSHKPFFVELGDAENCVLGRIDPIVDPALHDDALITCRIPEWMWRRLGEPDPETWVQIRKCDPPSAKTLVLRPRTDFLSSFDDPLHVLTTTLSGSGEGPGWACLSVASELPLRFGTFDVLEIRNEHEESISSACIFNEDVQLELVPPLSSSTSTSFPRPLPPVPPENDVPAITHVPPPSSSVVRPSPTQPFVPFSGKGQALGKK
jgi:hypothetical protein